MTPPERLMFCANCGIWELVESDLFCSWCNKEVFEIVVRKWPVRLYLDENAEPNNPRYISSNILTNKSPKRITLECMRPPAWLLIDPRGPITVESEASLEVKFGVDIRKLGGAPLKDDELVFQPLDFGPSNFKKAQIQVQLRPVPELSISPLTVFTPSSFGEVNLHFETEAALLLTKITFDPPYLSSVSDGPLDLPLGESPVPVRLNLPQPTKYQTHTIHYKIAAEGLPEPFRGQFQLIEKKAATLEIERQEAEYAKEIIPAIDDEIVFKLTNAGEENLTIKTIEIIPRGASPDIQITPGAYPSVLEPRRFAILKLLVSVGLQPQLGDHQFELVVDCNDPVPKNCRKTFPIEVIDRVFRGFVALDFGTTDSAVAIFAGQNAVPTSIPLEPNSDDKVKVYSNILFKGYSEGDVIPSIWTIGQDAKDLGPSLRERFVKAIKTKAGLGHIQRVYFDGKIFDLKAEDIIELIMLQLLKLTNMSLQGRPLKLILSVPTRFTLRQKEILREAIQKAASARKWFLDTAIIDESLAAGLFFILRRGPKDEQIRGIESYTLMILDFGGGTTDVTVFRVRQHIDPDAGLQIDGIEVIGAWGDPTLGGEEITFEIATLLASRFLKRTPDRKRDLMQIRKLEDEAEAVKIIVSELQAFSGAVRNDPERMAREASRLLRKNVAHVLPPTAIDNKVHDFLKTYLANDRQLTVYSPDFQGDTVLIKEQEVVEIFDKKLQKLKTELQILLSRILGKSDNKSKPQAGYNQVDVMLLAGQSAQFPTVAPLFQDLARKPIDFVRDSKGLPVLKECVSRGALYYSYHLSGDVPLNITGWDKRWTRIGKIVPFVEESKFDELIEWGHSYPCESAEFWESVTITSDGGHALDLDISENLSMNDREDERNLKPYKRFIKTVEGGSPHRYTCKLGVDAVGEIHAFCKIQDKWVEMEPIQ